MEWAEGYRRQVTLLVRTLPYVAREECFALKGGTAINLFVRDMPRLSVDIDLAYLPVAPREESLRAIDAAMKRIGQGIRKAMRGARIEASKIQPENVVTRLVVREASAQVKMEVTPVLRGCVYEPELRTVSAGVEDAFGFAEMRVVSFADLYAGKMVAALDRQHPRDLFGVGELLANEGVTENLRRAFAVYLISHNRPMAEILAPKRKSIELEFRRGFEGMTRSRVRIEELEAAREELIEVAVKQMPAEHRRFLVSFERGEPEWELLGVGAAPKLPAVEWRRRNLDQLSAESRAKLVAGLEAVFGRRRASGRGSGEV